MKCGLNYKMPGLGKEILHPAVTQYALVWYNGTVPDHGQHFALEDML